MILGGKRIELCKAVLSEYIARMDYPFSVDSLMKYHERLAIRNQCPKSVEKLCERYNDIWVKHEAAKEGYDFIAYVDGASDNFTPSRPSGAAYVILDREGVMIHEASKGFLKRTNNKMELLAIISAVNFIPEPKSVVVFSDSLYAINVLSGKWEASANWNLIEQYNRVKQGKRVDLQWVPGHCGFYWNEYADEMAQYQCERLKEECKEYDK